MADNKEGYMDGSIFYSTAMPKGGGDETKYNKAESDTIMQVLRMGATPEEVLAAQKLMIKLGYLDKGMDDGMLGPKTMGAARRYDSNTSTDQMFDLIKGKFDSIFGD